MAPVKTVNIFVHVERLGPEYDTGFVHFSLNLSAAVSGAELEPLTADEIRAWLRPWAWGDWTDVAVEGIDASGKTTELAHQMVTAETMPAVAALAVELDAELERVLTLPEGTNAFVFAANEPHRQEKVRENRVDWKSFVGHASTFPAPVPEALRLTAFFKVLASELTAANATEIVAAPMFAGGPFDGRRPMPLTDGTDTGNVASALRRDGQGSGGAALEFYRWTYTSSGTAPAIEALVNRAPIALPAVSPDAFLDPASMWVTKETALRYDWTIRLEQALADIFDLPRRLIDIATEQPDLISAEWHTAVIASFRDLADYGLRCPPDTQPLVNAVVEPLKPSANELSDLLDALDRDEQSRYATLDAWTAALQTYIDPARQTARVPAFADAAADPDGYLRAFDQIYSRLASSDQLAAFVFQQWDAVLGTGSSVGRAFWALHKDEIRVALLEMQIRKRLALANAGAAWRSLPAAMDDIVVVVANLFTQHLEHRFATPIAPEYDRYQPTVTTGLSPMVRDALIARVKGLVREILKPDTDAGRESGAAVNEDLEIQVDRLCTAGGHNDADDRDDFQRRLAGFGMLLRRQGSANWRALNFVSLSARGSDLGLPPVPAPLRLGYRNGVRQVYLSYRNQPMAAESPAANFSQQRKLLPPDAAGPDTPLLGYQNPYRTAGPQLEPLIYGRDYDVAAFAIGNAGHLPASAVAVNSHDEKLPSRFLLDSIAPAKAQTVSYRRRTPVGLIRFGSTNPRRRGEAMDRLALPPIPDDVLPLARSIQPLDATAPHLERKPALLLLTPSTSEWVRGRDAFSFTVRPPSVPIAVWDRWVADSPGEQQRRINVWARHHALLDAPDRHDQPDSTLDDPAVSQLEFTVTRLHTETPIEHVFTSTVARPTGACDGTTPGETDDPLACAHSPKLTIEIRVGDLTIPEGNHVEASLQLKFPAGHIWQVDIRPIVAAGHDRDRFEAPPARCEPVSLIVEVAAPLWQDGDEAALQEVRQQLHEALVPVFPHVGQESGERLAVLFNADRSLPAPLADRIHQIQLVLQRWRWDGRPLWFFDNQGAHYRFPFEKVVPSATDQPGLAPFDGTLFATRDSSDHQEIPTHVDFAAPPAKDAAGAVLAPAPLYDIDLTTLPGALYHRFGVLAVSRYKPLMTKNSMVDSRVTARTTAERWRRLVTACRWTKVVPKPVVKLIMPLTQTIDGRATPGLLAVLDEAWYADTMGGVAERFEWEIVQAALPDSPDTRRYQLGPDPIVSMAADPLAGRTLQRHEAEGAVGYTFDSDTAVPLFTRASFFLQPPEVEGIDDLSWFFVKIRMRRTLQFLSGGTRDRSSEWTESVWAQLLPPSDRLTITGADGLPRSLPAEKLALQCGSGQFVATAEQDVEAVTPQPTAIAGATLNPVFSLWVLTTRPVTDALGRRDRESFVNLVPLPENGKVPGAQPGFILRIVEVQRRAGVVLPNAKDLMGALFSQVPNADARARIVRVTTPIACVP